MNSIPALFTNQLVKLVYSKELSKIAGRIGAASIEMEKNRLYLFMDVAYNNDTGLINYSVVHFINGNMHPYEYDRAAHRGCGFLAIEINEKHSKAHRSVKPTDTTLLNWLNAPFDYVDLEITANDSSDILKLFSKHRTFDDIEAECAPNADLDRMILKSNEANRLKSLECSYLSTFWTLEDLVRFSSTNSRLETHRVSNADFPNFDKIVDLWMSKPEIFKTNRNYLGHEPQVAYNFQQHNFTLVERCNCSEMDAHAKPVDYRNMFCQHFVLEHGDRQALLTLWSTELKMTKAKDIREASRCDICCYQIKFRDNRVFENSCGEASI